ncbi:cilia- and flagella-associated protein 263-like [Gasterosteus aculeatus]
MEDELSLTEEQEVAQGQKTPPRSLQPGGWEQKLYVAQREVTDARADLEKAWQRCERVQDHYKAPMEKAEWHLADIRKAKKKFESKALKPLQDKRLEVKEPEKVLQYIKDKSKVAQMEKFHRKNRTLQAYKKKLQQQLQQKKETGKAECEVDHESCIISIRLVSTGEAAECDGGGCAAEQ